MKKRYISCFSLLLAGLFSYGQQVNIMPQPVSARFPAQRGAYSLHAGAKLFFADGALSGTAVFFNDYLRQYYQTNLDTTRQKVNTPAITLVLNAKGLPAPDSYTLSISRAGIVLKGNSEAAVFYGLQSLIQLLPVDGESTAKSAPLSLPYVSITDYPRFAYRGMHLDVGRHFFSVDFVKKYIDYIALHKMNYFHWHLTEDQGWRIEIKKYPRLTQTGAWRDGTIIGRYPGRGNDNLPYGGYYTQEEIKEVVAYAAKRYITVVPEIEMPGHSSAAIAAYPWLSCFPEEETQIPGDASAKSRTIKGKKVQETWGVFDDVYCAGNDSCFTFLENVLDEVMALFPSRYIHIGGDECPKGNWKRCPRCRARMQQLGLKDEHALQSYFIQRIEQYVNSRGRQIIGWDEILEGGLAANATVMSWRGEAGGIAAAKDNHFVIMTPGSHTYFDHSQTKNEDSVTIGGYLPLEKVYGYEPVPAVLTPLQAKKILGIQANLWTEYAGNPQKLEYLLFPRMSALSEVMWGPAGKKDYTGFQKRMQTQFRRYRLWNANYSQAFFEVSTAVLPAGNEGGVVWELKTALPQAQIVYSENVFDSIGLTGSKKYTRPVRIDHSSTWWAVALQNSRPCGKPILQQFFINKATGRHIVLKTSPSENYPGEGGARGLVNGILAKKGAGSSEWLEWEGRDMEAIIDLGKPQTVSAVACHLLEVKGSRIWLPAYMEVLVSANGVLFQPVGRSAVYTPDTNGMYKCGLDIKPVNARFVKVIAKNIGTIPAGERGAGGPARLFADEIEID
jgi:hexosaminidase